MGAMPVWRALYMWPFSHCSIQRVGLGCGIPGYLVAAAHFEGDRDV